MPLVCQCEIYQVCPVCDPAAWERESRRHLERRIDETEIHKLRRLLFEARKIILAVGESDHVQHGWLREVNETLR